MGLADIIGGAVIGSYTGIGAMQGALAGGILGSNLGRSLGRLTQGSSLVKPTTALLKSFYHMTFEAQTAQFGTVRHTLLVNPDSFDMPEPARVGVEQTLGGAYIADFGAGIPTVTISGVTGYKARYSTEGLYVDGFEEFILFRKNCYRDFINSRSPDDKLFWYNWEDNESYQIQPLDFKLQRSARQPTLYRYEYRFICLRPRGAPFAIFDSIMTDPSMQLVGSFLGGSKSQFLKALTLLGMSGQVSGPSASLGQSVRSALESVNSKLAGKGLTA